MLSGYLMLRSRALLYSLLFPAIVFSAKLRAVQQVELCPDISLESQEKIAFSESELKLLCGDPTSPGWQKVPRSQALFQLKAFLQAAGYYLPEIERHGKKTLVRLGDPTFIREVALTDAPPELKDWAAWEFKGERLTPGILKLLTDRLNHDLGVSGYACPRLDTEADPTSGRVVVKIHSGEKLPIIEVAEERVKDLEPGTLRRYDAFELGKPYNVDALNLTARRTYSDGIVRNTYFNAKCTDEGVVAKQKILAGKPREVTLGLGLNTDRGLSARASWKHSRLGPQGSQIFTSITASFMGRDFNTQEGMAEAALYVLPHPSRFHLRPLLNLRHQSDNRLETISGFVHLPPAITWDRQFTGGFVSLGPSLNAERKLRGEGRDQSYFLALTSDFRLTSHDFEWLLSDPKTGFEWTVRTSASHKGISADFTSLLLRTRFTHLFAWPKQGRRQLVIGTRIGLATTYIPIGEGGLAQLTPGLRHYLGGTTNLRGYAFQELPDQVGGLSAAFSSLELRGTGLLPWGLQPLVFADIGTVSSSFFDLTGRWYLSPGFGVRWASPVGVFRFSLAHGISLQTAPIPDPLSHWTFHLSFGEEF